MTVLKKGDRVRITACPTGVGIIEDDRWAPELYGVEMLFTIDTKFEIKKPMLYGKSALILLEE